MFLPPTVIQYLSHWLALKALVFSVWAAASPHFATVDSTEISEAIATAVLEEDTPVMGSVDEDAAVLATFAQGESGLHRDPRPQSWDALAHVSCGVWQQRCQWLAPTILGQARLEVELMTRGRVLCPASPMAPLSGGCHGAGRRLADARVARVRGLLGTW